jgi:endonuclease-3 related protein
MMLGAILTQNTSWNNVEKALQNLRENDLLSTERLNQLPASDLAEYLRPSGYFNIKSMRVKNLITFIEHEHQGDLESLFSLDIATIRTQLLSVRGIGMETADSIILYGAGKAVFVVDSYTYRILTRHSLIGEEAGYHDLQTLFMENLPHDVALFREFHALLVKAGKDFCRKTPRCAQCPLERLNKERQG